MCICVYIYLYSRTNAGSLDEYVCIFDGNIARTAYIKLNIEGRSAYPWQYGAAPKCCANSVRTREFSFNCKSSLKKIVSLSFILQQIWNSLDDLSFTGIDNRYRFPGTKRNFDVYSIPQSFAPPLLLKGGGERMDTQLFHRGKICNSIGAEITPILYRLNVNAALFIRENRRMQVIYGGEGVSGQRTIRTLDPIIQNEKLYVCVCMSEKKKGEKKNRHILLPRPLVFTCIYFACLYISKFDIDSGTNFVRCGKKKRKEGKKRYFADE